MNKDGFLNLEGNRFREKIENLISQMTLEEKIGQLVQYSGKDEPTGPGMISLDIQTKHERIKKGLVGSLLNVVSVKSTREAQELAVRHSRLGIPLLFGYDVIHGYCTMFPIPLGEAASWDLDLIRHSSAVAAREASAAGLHWTFAPMVDISRDARWGRVMEGAGEDPFLGAAVAKARIEGFQGTDLADVHTLAACAKHFAAYGYVQAGREYFTVDISEHTMQNVVLPPFKACLEAGVATFMNAFNEIGGIPATASVYLQREILKGEWGFKGFVVSDWASIRELISHGIAADEHQASALAIEAGSDMDMEGYCYEDGLAPMVKKGLINEAFIDDAVRRILLLKFQLGLFDDPFRYCDEKREKEEIYTPVHWSLARDAARKSIVLLKNEGSILPLKNEIGSLAVIGPLADDKDSPLGSWRAQAIDHSAVSLLEGIKAAVGKNSAVMYSKGCDLNIGPATFKKEVRINQTDKSQIGAAVEAARQAQVVVLALGENCFQSGEARSQVSIGLAGVQMDLFRAVRAVNPNIVVVLMNGRPLDVTELAANSMAVVETWHAGSQAGHAIADVLFGAYNPSGKLPMCFPRHVGQCPIYYGQKNGGRPKLVMDVFWSHYTDEQNDPLYPFGFGLSYTTFEYGPLRLSSDRLTGDEKLEISVKVTNSGSVDGEEVVQLYIRDLVGSVTRPVKELKGFEKVFIPSGQSKDIRFYLTREDLKFYTRNNRWEAEPGTFKVFVGSSSEHVLEADFELI